MPTPIPQLSAWENNVRTWSAFHYGNIASNPQATNLANSYYDATGVNEKAATYFGETTPWAAQANAWRTVYLVNYVIANNGLIPGYWTFTAGAYLNWVRTGSAQALEALEDINLNASFHPDWETDANVATGVTQRECAYVVQDYTNWERSGHTRRVNYLARIARSIAHIQAMLNEDSVICRYNDDDLVERVGYQSFMMGLGLRALIEAFTWDPTLHGQPIGSTIYGRTTLPTASEFITFVSDACSYLRTNAWNPTNDVWYYEVRNFVTKLGGDLGQAELNLLLAPAYAWAYWKTGNVNYRDWHNEAFAQAVLQGFWGGGKQFNQLTIWAFDGIGYYNNAEAVVQPALQISNFPVN